ncbi:hypothetical protein MPSEU_000825400 [Mayamaea pseudoterrestris]|nr:hypothetical protein MPSEU_000825400 [Mayamaea pseudoterrestris]
MRIQKLRLLLLIRIFCHTLSFSLTPSRTQRHFQSLLLHLSSTSTETATATTPLISIIAQQAAILDGPEYQTLQASLGRPLSKKNDAARWTIVVGETMDKERVVGVLASSLSIYTDSMAKLPTKQGNSQPVSPSLAISTFLHATTHVHSCLPPKDALLHKKQHWHVIIVGGGDLAVSSSVALQALGIQTTIVTTGSINKNQNSMPPVVGELQLGFAPVIGNFDVLLDTVGDEYCDQNSSVVKLLEQMHGCRRYLSTCTKAQEIVADEGILFGPNQAKQYVKRMHERNDLVEFMPPPGLGATVEALLAQGVTFPNLNNNPNKLTYYMRGWDLKTYWEATTWPRDAAGGANVRFGFPVPDDLDNVEERFMINEPPARQAAVLVDDATSGEEDGDAESNAFLVNVIGVNGLQSQIIDAQADCLLFLSAPFCRTCRYLSPQYLRMARMGQDSGVMFAKANATGKAGKDLGKALDVDSVPTFLLFRRGKLFGKPLSISRLPSRKLQVALDMLREEADWDDAKIREADDKPTT